MESVGSLEGTGAELLLHPETAGPVGGEVLGKACLNCPGLACLCLSLTSHLSYGAPGVEFTGLHRDAATVTQMHFLPGQVNICPPPAAGGPHPHANPILVSAPPLSGPPPDPAR